MGELPAPESPYDILGGADAVRRLTEAFYDAMEAEEPALAAIHQTDAEGRIKPEVRQRFGLFLVGWLGGPQDYSARYGHPRLRMRHARVRVGVEMRDAWLRSMTRAMDACGVEGQVRRFLDARFSEVATFLMNVEE